MLHQHQKQTMSDQAADSTMTPNSRKFLGLLSIPLMVFLTLGTAYLYLAREPASGETRSDATEGVLVNSDVAIGATEQLGEITSEQILGTWALNAPEANRVIENRADGTASIDVTFGFWASLLYGNEVHLELEWTLEDDLLTHTIVSGTPEKNKQKIIKDFGEKGYFKILSISEKQMHLVDFDDPPEEYFWKKVSEKTEVSAQK